MKLDDKGFVFLDRHSRPFWCVMYSGEPWFMYWNEGQKSWVTYERATQAEIWLAYQKRISEESAQIYHNHHLKFQNRWK